MAFLPGTFTQKYWHRELAAPCQAAPILWTSRTHCTLFRRVHIVDKVTDINYSNKITANENTKQRNWKKEIYRLVLLLMPAGQSACIKGLSAIGCTVYTPPPSPPPKTLNMCQPKATCRQTDFSIYWLLPKTQIFKGDFGIYFQKEPVVLAVTAQALQLNQKEGKNMTSRPPTH